MASSEGRPIPVPGIAPTRKDTRVPAISAARIVTALVQSATGLSSASRGKHFNDLHQCRHAAGFKGASSPDLSTTRLATDDIHSSIQAIDPTTGMKRWSYRINSPSIEAGVLTTASDMLFSGARDGSFFALDARTGTLLWQTNLGPSVAAGPITYAVNGKQYVSIMAGSSMFTFGLREPPAPSRP